MARDFSHIARALQGRQRRRHAACRNPCPSAADRRMATTPKSCSLRINRPTPCLSTMAASGTLEFDEGIAALFARPRQARARRADPPARQRAADRSLPGAAHRQAHPRLPRSSRYPATRASPCSRNSRSSCSRGDSPCTSTRNSLAAALPASRSARRAVLERAMAGEEQEGATGGQFRPAQLPPPPPHRRVMRRGRIGQS